MYDNSAFPFDFIQLSRHINQLTAKSKNDIAQDKLRQRGIKRYHAQKAYISLYLRRAQYNRTKQK